MKDLLSQGEIKFYFCAFEFWARFAELGKCHFTENSFGENFSGIQM